MIITHTVNNISDNMLRLCPYLIISIQIIIRFTETASIFLFPFYKKPEQVIAKRRKLKPQPGFSPLEFSLKKH